MDSRYKRKALIGLGVGLPLFVGGWALVIVHDRGPFVNFASATKVIAVAMILVSIPFYLWGCAALAKAKGYSRAFLFTCFLGWLFPMVVLLALPDKNIQMRRR
jgi:hypothetical protein